MDMQKCHPDVEFAATLGSNTDWLRHGFPFFLWLASRPLLASGFNACIVLMPKVRSMPRRGRWDVFLFVLILRIPSFSTSNIMI
jgi:hypothetical protein